MKIDQNDLLNSILEYLSDLDYIKPGDLPNIDLYMDQVTAFMEQQLAHTKRQEEDKILTKTMINNYAKNDLLPPPQKKKYSKEHMLMLIFIYYFKGILSINDIQAVLNPLTEQYFGKDASFNLPTFYNEVFQLEKDEAGYLQESIARKYHTSQETFQMLEGKEQEDLQNFAFICLLSFDIYLKKQMIEQMIDEMREEKKEEPREEKKGKKESKSGEEE